MVENIFPFKLNVDSLNISELVVKIDDVDTNHGSSDKVEPFQTVQQGRLDDSFEEKR